MGQSARAARRENNPFTSKITPQGSQTMMTKQMSMVQAIWLFLLLLATSHNSLVWSQATGAEPAAVSASATTTSTVSTVASVASPVPSVAPVPEASITTPAPGGNSSASTTSTAAPTTPANNKNETNSSEDETKAYEEFKKSPHFLPAFDPELIWIPKNQREVALRQMSQDHDLYRDIVREAINKRNSFAPSVQLLLKYSGKLIARMIKSKTEELKMTPKKSTPPKFYTYLADTYDELIRSSANIKRDKGYNKANVDTEDLYKRVDSLFSSMVKVLEVSPVGPFLKWQDLVMSKDNLTSPSHNKRLMDEGADLGAELRAIGYEPGVFLVKRIINLLRMFGKGLEATASSV